MLNNFSEEPTSNFKLFEFCDELLAKQQEQESFLGNDKITFICHKIAFDSPKEKNKKNDKVVENEPKTKNVKLSVSNEGFIEIHANRSILSARSSYFQKLIEKIPKDRELKIEVNDC